MCVIHHNIPYRVCCFLPQSSHTVEMLRHGPNSNSSSARAEGLHPPSSPLWILSPRYCIVSSTLSAATLTKAQQGRLHCCRGYSYHSAINVINLFHFKLRQVKGTLALSAYVHVSALVTSKTRSALGDHSREAWWIAPFTLVSIRDPCCQILVQMVPMMTTLIYAYLHKLF